jgi:hypothetical protein
MDPQVVSAADICFHPRIGQFLPKIRAPYAASFLAVETNFLFQRGHAAVQYSLEVALGFFA